MKKTILLCLLVASTFLLQSTVPIINGYKHAASSDGNLLVAGNDVTNAAWNKINLGYSKAYTAFSGGLGNVIVANTTNGVHDLVQTVPKPPASKNYTFSFYTKNIPGAGAIAILLVMSSTGGGCYVQIVTTDYTSGFGIQNYGTGFTASGYTVEAVSDSYYKVTFSFNANASVTTIDCLYRIQNYPEGENEYSGDNTRGAVVSDFSLIENL